MYRSIFVLFIVSTAFSFACRPNNQTGKNAAGNVNKTSELASDPEQQRLWKAALEKNNANALENIPVPGEPVQARAQPTIPNKQVDGKPQPLPAGMTAGVRLIKSPELQGQEFKSTVRVRSVEGERLELDLGGQSTLSMFARARGGALRAAVGDTAQLDLRQRDDPYDRQQILALRFENGDGIVSALDSSDKPLTISIPIFQLTASQVGEIKQNAMSVAVTVGDSRQLLASGQTVVFEAAGLTVGIVGSSAYVGDQEPSAEGRPYALYLVAWPNR